MSFRILYYETERHRTKFTENFRDQTTRHGGSHEESSEMRTLPEGNGPYARPLGWDGKTGLEPRNRDQKSPKQDSVQYWIHNTASLALYFLGQHPITPPPRQEPGPELRSFCPIPRQSQAPVGRFKVSLRARRPQSSDRGFSRCGPHSPHHASWLRARGLQERYDGMVGGE